MIKYTVIIGMEHCYHWNGTSLGDDVSTSWNVTIIAHRSNRSAKGCVKSMLNRPHGISVGPHGELYVCDTMNYLPMARLFINGPLFWDNGSNAKRPLLSISVNTEGVMM